MHGLRVSSKAKVAFGVPAVSVKSGVYCYPRAQINSTDKDVLEEFARVVGIGNILPNTTKKEEHHKDQWCWIASRTQDVMELYILFKPWLKARRTLQAEVALQKIGKQA